MIRIGTGKDNVLLDVSDTPLHLVFRIVEAEPKELVMVDRIEVALRDWPALRAWIDERYRVWNGAQCSPPTGGA